MNRERQILHKVSTRRTLTWKIISDGDRDDYEISMGGGRFRIANFSNVKDGHQTWVVAVHDDDKWQASVVDFHSFGAALTAIETSLLGDRFDLLTGRIRPDEEEKNDNALL